MDAIAIIISAIIVTAIGCPIVNAFEKRKREMDSDPSDKE